MVRRPGRVPGDPPDQHAHRGCHPPPRSRSPRAASKTRRTSEPLLPRSGVRFATIQFWDITGSSCRDFERYGELRANPNCPTWRQSKTRAAASFGPGTRRLRFGSPKPSSQNPAESRDFPGRLALLPKSLCSSRLHGGGSGIRTHGTFRCTRFPSVRPKPARPFLGGEWGELGTKCHDMPPSGEHVSS